MLRRPLEARQKTFATLMAEAPKRRNRAAAQRGIPPEERDSYRIAVVPHNRYRSATLSRQRRAAFEAHLRNSLTKARARLAAGEEPAPETRLYSPTDPRSDAERAAEHKLLGAGCAACRGMCCRMGGDHAFNDSDTMMRYLQRSPDHDDTTIVERYLSHMASRTMSHGCVFQHEDGCTLPRDLRADVCNRYYCGELSVLRNHYLPGDPVRAYFLNYNGGRMFGGRFVSVPVVED